ncbi:MAG: PIN domain-containing protein [Chloroflexi bacterium]|nr:PIN domain-containing protein [Chloroflexota bacterium]
MPARLSRKLRVFVDADVIFAGSAAPSEHSASHLVLRMGEITLLDCVTSQQAITEAERNLRDKLPSKLPEFRLIVSRCLRVVPDPEPADLASCAGQAEAEDLPILVAALREECAYLLTFNVRHFYPASQQISVQQPGEFILAVRQWLGALAA